MNPQPTQHRKVSKIYFVIIGVLVIYSIVITGLHFQKTKCPSNQIKTNFTLISTEVSSLSVPEFLEKQKTLTISYRHLREPLLEVINSSSNRGHYGLYFEDLTSGAWVGINERENAFIPASLLKLPILVAVLKKVEKQEIQMEDKYPSGKEDLDSRYGSLWKKGEGYKTSVSELLDYLVKESDNTAMNVLQNQVITTDELIEAQFAMGLPPPEQISNQKMSPRGYSNILRSLYLSSYLRRTFSEKALSVMIDTQFNSGIPANLPNEIKVAHKIGVSNQGGYHHDCGIVYLPDKPFLLCIMSANSTQEESDKVISEASKVIYDYLTK